MTTTLAQPARFTPEDVIRLEERGLYELVDGKLVEKAMSSLANKAAARISYWLVAWSDAGGGGEIYAEQTFRCFPSDSELVRRPDVAFISSQRIGRVEETGHVSIAPDLAVEVISPNDTIDELEEKISEYFAAGVKTVWAVNPKFRWVRVHRPGQPLLELKENDVLADPEVLPGFSVTVHDLVASSKSNTVEP